MTHPLSRPGAILSTRILHARRSGRYGRVEALVEVVWKPQPGQPSRMRRILTDTAATLDRGMRTRLLSSAVALALCSPESVRSAAA